MDKDPTYTADGAPVPPTFPFVMPYCGSLGEGGAAGWPVEHLRGKGWALLDTCFTDDAEVDYSSNPGGKAGPYKQIRSWLEKMLSAFPVTQHLMSNIDVQLDGDRAKARTMVVNPQGAATREGPLHFF